METRFYPSNINVVNQNDYELLETNKVFSSFFKSIEINHNEFPYYQELSIAVVVPQSGSSFEEFKNQITASDNIYLEKIPTNIQDQELIIKTLKKIIDDKQHNILAIVRGGGDQLSLDIFDDPDICELVAKFEGYKLIGIGHNRDRSLLELVVNYAADTPTAAGSYLNTLTANLESFKSKFIDDVKSEMYQQQLDDARVFEQSISAVKLELTQKLSNSEDKICDLTKKLSKLRYVILILIAFIAIFGYYIFSSHELQHTTDIEKNTSDTTQELKPTVTDNANNNQKHNHK